jgi:hypothetical protein
VKRQLSDKSLKIMDDMTSETDVWVQLSAGTHSIAFKINRQDLAILEGALDGSIAPPKRNFSAKAKVLRRLHSKHYKQLVLSNVERQHLSQYVKELEFEES